MIRGHSIPPEPLQNFVQEKGFNRAYEIDFIGVGDEVKKDADAITIRWKDDNGDYKIAVYDGGLQAHGDKMVEHLNEYYFSDSTDKVIDCVICSHSDLDHASGLKRILEEFEVKKLYMNRPWLYIDDVWDSVSDGRITKESLCERLKKEYQYISDLEKMAEDKERKRISREIHDTLGHALTGISAGIDACIALIDIDPQKSKEQLLVISNVVRESIKDVRRSLYKLRPGALDQRTLKDGLIKMIEEFQSVSHLNVDLYYEWENVDFENTKEDIIFRIIQETMTNALRHGHASHIEIHLFDEEEKYMIIMQDNGSGCKEIHYGYGLKQMHERVAILNGTIHFYSEEGFRTVVEIPKIGGKKDD